MSEKSARDCAYIIEKALEIKEDLVKRIEHHAACFLKGETVGMSPLHQLKLDALARLALLAEFHDSGVKSVINVDPKAAIAFAVDSANIMRISQELVSIDCDLTPPTQP